MHRLYERKGGVEEIEVNSVLSKKRVEAREELVKEIARVFSTEFDLKNKVDGPIEDIVKDLRSKLPIVSKLSGKKNVFEHACKKIAEVFNKHFGKDFIDVDNPSLCEDVSDKIYSLTVQINGEYFEVLANASTIIKNIHTVVEALKNNYNNFSEDIKSPIVQDFHRSSIDVLENLAKNLKMMIGQKMDVDFLKEVKDSETIKKYFKRFKNKYDEGLHKIFNTTFNFASLIKKINSLCSKLGITLEDVKKIAQSPNPALALAGKLSEKIKNEKNIDEFLKAYSDLDKLLSDKAISIRLTQATPIKGSGDTLISLNKKIEKKINAKLKLFIDTFNYKILEINDIIRDLIVDINNGTVKASELNDLAFSVQELPEITTTKQYYQYSGILNELSGIAERENLIFAFENIIFDLENIKSKIKSDKIEKLITAFKNFIAFINESVKSFQLTNRKYGSGKAQEIMSKIGQSIDNVGEVITQFKPIKGKSELSKYLHKTQLPTFGDISKIKNLLLFTIRKNQVIDRMKSMFKLNAFEDDEKIVAKSIANIKDNLTTFCTSVDDIIDPNYVHLSNLKIKVVPDIRSSFKELLSENYTARWDLLELAEALENSYKEMFESILQKPEAIESFLSDINTDIIVALTDNSPVASNNILLLWDNKTNIQEQMHHRLNQTIMYLSKSNNIKTLVVVFSKILEKNNYKSTINIYDTIVKYISVRQSLVMLNTARGGAPDYEIKASNDIFYNGDLPDIFTMFTDLNFELLFVQILNSMVGKINLLVDTYLLVKKPLHQSLGYSLSASRFILGGSETVLNDNLLELYIRVPLLVKFYKNVFDNKPWKKDAENEVIYSELRLKDPLMKLYKLCYYDSLSEDNVKDIISICNVLYDTFKDKPNPVLQVLNEIINDVNSKIGLFNYKKESEKIQELDYSLKMYDTDNVLQDSSNKYMLPSNNFILKNKHNLDIKNKTLLKYDNSYENKITDIKNKILAGVKKVFPDKTEVKSISSEMNSLNTFVKNQKKKFTAISKNEKITLLTDILNNGSLSVNNSLKRISEYTFRDAPVRFIQSYISIVNLLTENLEPISMDFAKTDFSKIEVNTPYKHIDIYDNNFFIKKYIGTSADISIMETEIKNKLPGFYSVLTKIFVEKDRATPMQNLILLFPENKELIKFIYNHNLGAGRYKKIVKGGAPGTTVVLSSVSVKIPWYLNKNSLFRYDYTASAAPNIKYFSDILRIYGYIKDNKITAAITDFETDFNSFKDITEVFKKRFDEIVNVPYLKGNTTVVSPYLVFNTSTDVSIGTHKINNIDLLYLKNDWFTNIKNKINTFLTKHKLGEDIKYDFYTSIISVAPVNIVNRAMTENIHMNVYNSKLNDILYESFKDILSYLAKTTTDPLYTDYIQYMKDQTAFVKECEKISDLYDKYDKESNENAKLKIKDTLEALILGTSYTNSFNYKAAVFEQKVLVFAKKLTEIFDLKIKNDLAYNGVYSVNDAGTVINDPTVTNIINITKAVLSKLVEKAVLENIKIKTYNLGEVTEKIKEDYKTLVTNLKEYFLDEKLDDEMVDIIYNENKNEIIMFNKKIYDVYIDLKVLFGILEKNGMPPMSFDYIYKPFKNNNEKAFKSLIKDHGFANLKRKFNDLYDFFKMALDNLNILITLKRLDNQKIHIESLNFKAWYNHITDISVRRVFNMFCINYKLYMLRLLSYLFENDICGCNFLSDKNIDFYDEKFSNGGYNKFVNLCKDIYGYIGHSNDTNFINLLNDLFKTVLFYNTETNEYLLTDIIVCMAKFIIAFPNRRIMLAGNDFYNRLKTGIMLSTLDGTAIAEAALIFSVSFYDTTVTNVNNALNSPIKYNDSYKKIKPYYVSGIDTSEHIPIDVSHINNAKPLLSSYLKTYRNNNKTTTPRGNTIQIVTIYYNMLNFNFIDIYKNIGIRITSDNITYNLCDFPTESLAMNVINGTRIKYTGAGDMKKIIPSYYLAAMNTVSRVTDSVIKQFQLEILNKNYLEDLIINNNILEVEASYEKIYTKILIINALKYIGTPIDCFGPVDILKIMKKKLPTIFGANLLVNTKTDITTLISDNNHNILTNIITNLNPIGIVLKRLLNNTNDFEGTTRNLIAAYNNDNTIGNCFYGVNTNYNMVYKLDHGFYNMRYIYTKEFLNSLNLDVVTNTQITNAIGTNKGLIKYLKYYKDRKKTAMETTMAGLVLKLTRAAEVTFEYNNAANNILGAITYMTALEFVMDRYYNILLYIEPFLPSKDRHPSVTVFLRELNNKYDSMELKLEKEKENRTQLLNVDSDKSNKEILEKISEILAEITKPKVVENIVATMLKKLINVVIEENKKNKIDSDNIVANLYDMFIKITGSEGGNNIFIDLYEFIRLLHDSVLSKVTISDSFKFRADLSGAVKEFKKYAIDNKKYYNLSDIINKIENFDLSDSKNLNDSMTRIDHTVFKLQPYFKNFKINQLSNEFALILEKALKSLSEKKYEVIATNTLSFRYFYGKIINPLLEESLLYEFVDKTSKVFDQTFYTVIKRSILKYNETKGTKKYIEDNYDLLGEFYKSKIKRNLGYHLFKFKYFLTKVIYYKDIADNFVSPIDVSILQKMINISNNMIGSLTEIHNDIIEDSIIGEVNKNAFKNFKQINSIEPFYPPLGFLALLHNNKNPKLLYANRYIFSDKSLTDKQLISLHELISNDNFDKNIYIDNNIALNNINFTAKMFKYYYSWVDISNIQGMHFMSYILSFSIPAKNGKQKLTTPINTKRMNNATVLEVLEENRKAKAIYKYYKLICTEYDNLSKLSKYINYTTYDDIIREEENQNKNNKKMLDNITDLIYKNIIEYNLVPVNMRLLFRSILFSNLQLLSAVLSNDFRFTYNTEITTLLNLNVKEQLSKLFKNYLVTNNNKFKSIELLNENNNTKFKTISDVNNRFNNLI